MKYLKKIKKNRNLIFVFLGLLACFLTLEQAIAQKSTDILAKDTFTLQGPETVSGTLATEDLNILIYALQHGYGGKSFPKEIGFKNAISALTQLLKETNNSVKNKTLCSKIDDILWTIQDDHLMARRGKEFCSNARLNKFMTPSTTGKNRGADKVWDIQFVDVDSLKIPVISITKFADYDDVIWKGFLEETETIKKTAPALILDMRGNGGGDDQIGIELAKQMFGGPFPNPIEKSVAPTHSARYALRANSWKLSEIKLKLKNQPVPDYLEKNYADQISLMKKATDADNSEEIKESAVASKFSAQNGFAKPIFILVDRQCASSCEHTLEYFEAHPFVTTVGQNTAGLVHFGDTGQLVLPNSQIVVQIPIKYIQYRDKRFVERVGYTPAKLVSEGQDSLQVAIDLIKKEAQKKENNPGFRESKIVIQNEKLKPLSAFLTKPSEAKTKGRVLILLGSGRGSTDDPTRSYNPFAKIARQLSEMGYGTLRFDKRGTGYNKDTGNFSLQTIDNYYSDASQALSLLTKQTPDAKSTIIFAHSIGNIILSRLAENFAVDGLIMSSGPSEKMIDVMKEQLKTLNLYANGGNVSDAERNVQLILEPFELVTKNNLTETNCRHRCKKIDGQVVLDDESIEFWNQLFRFSMSEQLNKLKKVKSVLCIGGKSDFVVEDYHASKNCTVFQKNGINQKTVILENFDHFLSTAPTKQASVETLVNKNFSKLNFNERFLSEMEEWLNSGIF